MSSLPTASSTRRLAYQGGGNHLSLVDLESIQSFAVQDTYPGSAHPHRRAAGDWSGASSGRRCACESDRRSRSPVPFPGCGDVPPARRGSSRTLVRGGRIASCRRNHVAHSGRGTEPIRHVERYLERPVRCSVTGLIHETCRRSDQRIARRHRGAGTSAPRVCGRCRERRVVSRGATTHVGLRSGAGRLPARSAAVHRGSRGWRLSR